MNRETAIAAIATITSVEAVELKNGKFQIDAIFANGDREILKAKSNKKPAMIQAFTFGINGNYKGEGIGHYFAFSKTVPSHYKDEHIKAFIVN